MTFPANLKLFSILGQSNAWGMGDIADWPGNRPRHGSRIWNYKTNGTWQAPATEPISGTHVGPSLSFADRLADINPTWNIGLVPCAKTGSSISDWQESGTLFENAKSRTKQAAQDSGGFLCGVVFSQGEKDTMTQGAAAAWLRLAKRMINAWRHSFSTVTPFVLIQLGNLPDALAGDYPYWEQIRADQEIIVDELHRMRLVETDDLSLPSDDIHWATAEQITIGGRAANHMNAVVKGLGGRFAA